MKRSLDYEWKEYDITVFQTPMYGQKKGYRQVYRELVEATDHEDAMNEVFSLLNVRERLPLEYHARFMATGDIVCIDEGTNGQFYYQLSLGGFKPIHRMHVR